MKTGNRVDVSLRLLCLTALAYAAAGCIAEDMSGCPPAEPNVRIAFTLFDGGIFTDEITSVTALLFDGQGKYIPPATTLGKADLERYAGVRLALVPGDYRMVLWANVDNNAEIRVIDGTPVVTYKDFTGTAGPVPGDGDPVWYAPAVPATRVDTDARALLYHEFRAPAKGSYTDRVAFTEAHNALNIFIGGLPHDAASMPTVEITNLAPAVTLFGMRPLDTSLPTVTAAMQTVSVKVDKRSYAMAAFVTLPLGDMAGMYIVIKNADGNEIFRIPLADAITQSSADPTAHEISLLLNFGDMNVSVEIWDWDDNELEKNW